MSADIIIRKKLEVHKRDNAQGVGFFVDFFVFKICKNNRVIIKDSTISERGDKRVG